MEDVAPASTLEAEAPVDDVARHSKGANFPPPDEPSEFDKLKSRVAELVATANRWATERPKITDKEIAAKCDDFLNQIAAQTRLVEERRKGENKPHQDAIDANNASYGALKKLLDAIKGVLSPRMAAWLQAERDRIEAEKRRQQEEAAAKLREAEEAKAKALLGTGNVIESLVAADGAEKEAEAAMKAASRKAPRAQVRGEHSPRARSLRTTWHARVTDITKAFANYQDRPEVLEVLTSLACADARAASGKITIPGCEVYSQQSV